MRILVIRGKNLASLAGEFEVRLDADPLAKSGVFAIVGKTGSGKSTILDAMCLALFNQTPRLEARGGAPIGHADATERISSNDVRGLLRKGAADGYAEVEYVGVDGVAYVARWDVRRARGKTDGRLQDPTLSLRRRDSGQVIASTKTGMKSEVPRTLGLTFEQLRRTVLLAQGEFAAFLKAEPDERAELLELMTGTEIYAQLSRAAYERSKEARDALQLLESQAGGCAPLREEARAELEREVEALRGAHASELEELGRLQAAQRWHVDADRLALELSKAGEALTEAKSKHEEGAPLRLDLERTEAAETERAVVTELDAAVSADEKAHGAQVAAAARVQLAEQAKTQTEAAATTAAQALETVKGALADARPELDAARKLDAELALLQKSATDSAGAWRKLAKRRTDLQSSIQKLATDLGNARAQLANAEAWLAERAANGALIESWPTRRQELEDLQGIARAIADARNEHAALLEEQRVLVDSEATATESERTARVERDASRNAADQAETELDAHRERDLAGEQDEVSELRTHVNAAKNLRETHRALLARRGRHDAALVDANETHANAKLQAEQLHAQRPQLESDLARARRTHELARTALDLEAHRAELRDGEACPLCGSEQHPYAHNETLGTLESESGAHVTQLEGELRGLLADVSRHDATLANTAQSITRHAGERAPVERDLGDVDARWADLREHLEIPDAPDHPDAAQHLASCSARAEGLRLGLAFVLAERSELERAQQASSMQLRTADAALERAQTTVREATKRRTIVDSSLAALASKLEQHEGDHARRQARLDVVFVEPDWAARFAADPDAFIAQWTSLASQWTETVERRDGASGSARDLESRKGAAEEQLAENEPHLADAQAKAENDDRELRDARKARGELLGGQDADGLERALSERLARVDADHATAMETARVSREAHVEACTQHRGANAALKAAVDRLEAARHAFAGALARLELTDEGLRALLARGPEWARTTKATLQALDSAVQRAEATLQERETKLEAHREQRPDLDIETLPALLEAANTRTTAANEAHIEAKSRLVNDDDRRAQTQALQAELRRAEDETALWSRMAALIGSSDGKRFRTFAQGLTLDILLTYANHQLAELHPRYRLQRVPGEDLELQVLDRDMGDEVRSIQSLSGGETFLASLALALGLSALSANQTPIESLFIDEGFGALDPESLELVLEVLDSLHASGRQVGVISHVEAIAERFAAQVQVEDLGGGRSRIRVQPVGPQDAHIARVA